MNLLHKGLRIRGGRSLCGAIAVQGAKNSTLPLLAAALLCKGESVFYNCPALSDCTAATDILSALGCRVQQEGKTILVNADPADDCTISEELMRRMRSSIVFLGAILGRMGEARLSYPGGCELGPRPIDLHLHALKQLGVQIQEDGGNLYCTVPNGLRGARISLSFPSVGATENILLAATMADGDTVLCNAAQEPEIVDLATYLNACGAQIHGAGESTVTVHGVKTLFARPHKVIPDRIAAATYLCMAAATRGEVYLHQTDPTALSAMLPLWEQMGCTVKTDGDTVHLNAKARSLRALPLVRTMPYPGFPTDAQPPFMTLACTADGCSLFVETIFENRYKHVDDLIRMGAQIHVEGRTALVSGATLHGATVTARDLRGGAALVTAALAAEGETILSGVSHIDRGYAQFEQTLTALGADIERIHI